MATALCNGIYVSSAWSFSMTYCGSTPHGSLLQASRHLRVFSALPVNTLKALIHLSKFDARERRGLHNALGDASPGGLSKRVASCHRPLILRALSHSEM